MCKLAPYLFNFVEKGWTFISLNPHRPLCQLLPHPWRSQCTLFPPKPSLQLRYLMEMGGPVRGLGIFLILLQPSWAVLEAQFFIRERSRLLQLLPLHLLRISSPRYPFLQGKGQAKDLKQALLGRQPKYFITFGKKKNEKKERKTVCLSPPPNPPLSSSTISFPVPLVFFICPFHCGQWKSQAWGWSCSSLGEIVDFGEQVEWHNLHLHHIDRMSCSFTRLSLHLPSNSVCSLEHIG